MILPRASTQLNPALPTANGLDKLPAWFLTLAAPVLCGPDQQYVVVDVICTEPMEASAHPACPENFGTAAGRGLSACIHHAGTIPHC